MTRINLNSIIIDFPEKPSKIWDHDNGYIFHDYRAKAYFLGNEIGHITVSIALAYPENERNDFWFCKKGKKTIARPVAVFQETAKAYRGQGINVKLLKLVNKIVKARFNEPLASDTTFVGNADYQWKEKNYAERPGIRTWEKLQKERLAYLKLYKDNPRWIMY